MNDADAGRDDFEGVESLFAPFEKFVALAVAMEFEVEIVGEGVGRSGEVDLHRVIDDQIDRDERLDHFRIAAHRMNGGAHGGEIDEKGNTGEILEDDPRNDERDFEIAGIFRVVVREVFDVVF